MSQISQYYVQLILSTSSSFTGPFTYRSFISELFSRGLRRVPSQGTFVKVMMGNKDRFEWLGRGTYKVIA